MFHQLYILVPDMLYLQLDHNIQYINPWWTTLHEENMCLHVLSITIRYNQFNSQTQKIIMHLVNNWMDLKPTKYLDNNIITWFRYLFFWFDKNNFLESKPSYGTDVQKKANIAVLVFGSLKLFNDECKYPLPL